MNESSSMVQQSFNFSFLPPHIYDKTSFTLQIMCPERQSLNYVQLLLINKQRNFPVIKVKTSTFFLFSSVPHQEACLQGNLIANCLEQLSDPHPLLRQWVAICLGRIWQNFDSARWCGVRDSAHEKLYTLLSDPVPEVMPEFGSVCLKLPSLGAD